MRAFSLRASRRLFRPQPLPLQIVSELLWAAFGVNRPASGGRTAPSAYGAEDIDVYLATGGGLLRYAANGHRLLPVRPDDLRAATGSQPFVAAAPLDLVYVSDSARLAAAGIAAGEQAMFSWAHSGFIAQNVYLFCASEGLASVVRSTIDREALAARMGLASTQQITLAQTVGYPG
jgi:nitroreductase